MDKWLFKWIILLHLNSSIGICVGGVTTEKCNEPRHIVIIIDFFSKLRLPRLGYLQIIIILTINEHLSNNKFFAVAVDNNNHRYLVNIE